MRERKKALSKEECKNVKNVHYNCQGRLFARLKNIHCCHFVIFWLLPVGAAHGTPFYSQHARLIKAENTLQLNPRQVSKSLDND